MRFGRSPFGRGRYRAAGRATSGGAHFDVGRSFRRSLDVSPRHAVQPSGYDDTRKCRYDFTPIAFVWRDEAVVGRHSLNARPSDSGPGTIYHLDNGSQQSSRDGKKP